MTLQSTISRRLSRSRRSRRGQTFVEYTLIMVWIILVIVSMLDWLGVTLFETFDTINAQLDKAVNQDTISQYYDNFEGGYLDGDGLPQWATAEMNAPWDPISSLAGSIETSSSSGAISSSSGAALFDPGIGDEISQSSSSSSSSGGTIFGLAEESRYLEIGDVDNATASYNNDTEVLTLTAEGDWDLTHDAATFAMLGVTGDFDARVRVDGISGGTDWSRAGLMARDSTDAGAIMLWAAVTKNEGTIWQVRNSPSAPYAWGVQNEFGADPGALGYFDADTLGENAATLSPITLDSRATISNISLGGSLTPATGPVYIGSADFPATRAEAITNNAYLEFSIEPEKGYAIDPAALDLVLGIAGEGAGAGGGEEAFLESGGRVVMEAENYDSITPGTGNVSGHNWEVDTSRSGYSGDSALIALPNQGRNNGGSDKGPVLNYKVNFSTTGTYRIWVRMLGANGNDDSVRLGVDGSILTNGGVGVSGGSSWGWEYESSAGVRADFTVNSAGVRTINIFMREDGVRVDKLVVQLRSGLSNPSGSGPDESERGGSPWQEGLSGTGVAATTMEVRSSTDGFTSDDNLVQTVDISGLPTNTAIPATVNLTGIPLIEEETTFRIYFYGDTSSNAFPVGLVKQSNFLGEVLVPRGPSWPRWVRMVRLGPAFTMYYDLAGDGTDWFAYSSHLFLTEPNVQMIVGPAVGSRDDSTTATAQFSNFEITPLN